MLAAPVPPSTSFEDSDLGRRPGKVWVSYNSPHYLEERQVCRQELLQNIAVVETLAAKAGE